MKIQTTNLMLGIFKVNELVIKLLTINSKQYKTYDFQRVIAPLSNRNKEKQRDKVCT